MDLTHVTGIVPRVKYLQGYGIALEQQLVSILREFAIEFFNLLSMG